MSLPHSDDDGDSSAAEESDDTEGSGDEYRLYQRRKFKEKGSSSGSGQKRKQRTQGINFDKLDNSKVDNKKSKGANGKANNNNSNGSGTKMVGDREVSLTFKAAKQTRRKWTYEEEEAVKNGFKRFGDESNVWSRIKSDYSEILANRTSVQIKDKWRTICKQMGL